MIHKMKNLYIFVSIICLIISGIVFEAHGDNALVTIDFHLRNIAISKDRDSQPMDTISEPGSFDYSMGDVIISNEEIKDARGEAASRYPEIQRTITEIEKETKWGRTVDIRWKIVNYEPRQDILCTINPSNGYHFFSIRWFRNKIDLRYLTKDGEWKFSQYVPTMFRFKSPSPATIKGYGDVPVFIPGVTFDLKKVALWSIEKVISKENYRIVVNRYPVEKTLHLQTNDRGLQGKRLEVEGRTILGDSGIKTERRPFLFPFDRYSFEFIYTSFFPSIVTLQMVEVEDLNLSHAKKMEYHFPAGRNTKLVKIELDRNLSEISWNLITLFLTLTALFVTPYIKGRRKKGLRRFGRVALYTVAGILIYWRFPKPLNVPLVNLLSLGASVIFMCLVGKNEISPYWQRIRMTLANYGKKKLLHLLKEDGKAPKKRGLPK